MNEMTVVILALSALAAFCIWFYIQHKNRVRNIETRVLNIKDRRTAPSGLRLWIENGVGDPDIRAIEQGLLTCFVKAGCIGYTRAMNLSDYTIALVKGEPDSDGNPCYRIPAGAYAGTVYDKGGYILVAGQMIAAGEGLGNIIAIPEHFAGQEAHLSLVAEYEAEHVILAMNDWDEFERTRFHGAGTGHPIIPDCNGSFSHPTPPGYLCGTPVERMIAANEYDPQHRQPISFLSE